MKVFIKYNKVNVHALGSADGKAIEWMRPGWNEFPKYMWDQYVPHPDIKKMLADGVIEVMTDKVTGKNDSGKKVVKDLGKGFDEFHVKDLEEKKALEVIKGTNDPKLLQRWLDEETRHKVKRAIDAQLKPLLPENQSATA